MSLKTTNQTTKERAYAAAVAELKAGVAAQRQMLRDAH